VRRIDASEAERMPGVRRIIRGADVPKNLNTLLSLLNFGKDDEPTLATDKVRYKGEPLVAVVANSEREAFEAIAHIRVDYEPLTPVFDVEEALRPGAPVVNETYPRNTFEYHGKYDHQKLRFGDVEQAFSQADHVLEQRYQMSPIEHAPTETNGAIAAPEANGRFVVYTCAQGLFFSLDTCAKILDVPSNKLHFVGGTVGGGFGGKVDSLTEPLATLGSMLTGRPVRYVLGREEEMQFGSPRGAERIFIKDAVMKDGRITARKVRGLFDSGAYTRLSSYAVIKCAAHIPGPYTIPNVYADIYCVYTNRVPATAMRGFGVTAVDFAIECQMDKLADLIGMDPMEFRILNAYRDGDMKAHRREAKNTALVECVQVAAEKAKWPIREEFKRASSRVGGGGARAAIPHTRLDGGAAASTPSAPQRTTYDRPVPPLSPPSPSPALQRPAASEPLRPPPAPPPPASPAATTHGAARFSSVFGTRRR
jgi:CO/xanthine dehydrogenase Mo-binding subunit